MVDNPTASPASPQQLINAPPTQSVSQFLITETSAEFLLTVGVPRVAFDPTTGHPAGSLFPEWLLTLA